MDAIGKKGFPHGHTVVLKMDFVKRIVPFMFAGDEWFAVCAVATGNIGCINEKLIYFRRHDSSFSRSEGGGKKLNMLSRIRYSSFDDYFVWPDCQYEAYKRYLELFENILEDNIKKLVEKHMIFNGELDSLRNMGRFSELKKLYRLYKMDEYKLYRGNRNTFIMDCAFLFFYSKR